MFGTLAFSTAATIFSASGAVHRERLFAQDHFAGFGGGDADFGVDIVRRSDVDHVDVIARDQFAPIGFDRFVAPFFGEGFGVFFVAGANGFENRLIFEVEEIFDLRESVGVRAAHEAVTDESDAKLFHKLCGTFYGNFPGKQV